VVLTALLVLSPAVSGVAVGAVGESGEPPGTSAAMDGATATGTAVDDDGNYTYRVPFSLNHREFRNAYHSNLIVEATANGTTLSIDADADGSSDRTVGLDAGEAHVISDPHRGVAIESTERANVRYDYGTANYGAYEDGQYAYGVPAERRLGTEYALPLPAERLHVVATAGTTVEIDRDGDGTVDRTASLATGETVTLSSVRRGGRLTATEPIHVVAERADFGSLDGTYLTTLLPVSRARANYALPGELSYNVQNAASHSGVYLVGTANGTAVTVDVGRDGPDAADRNLTIDAGESRRVQFVAPAYLNASAPVVATYEFNVSGTDWWQGTHRDYVAATTPVTDTHLTGGSWSGKHFDGGVKAWSDYSGDGLGDRVPPTVTGFGATTSGGDVVVSVRSDEPLRDLSVGVVNLTFSLQTKLTDDDFERVDAADGSYTYVANASFASGTYTAILQRAADAAGNDGAAFEQAPVSVGPAADDHLVVDADGLGEYGSIQAALDAADDGDTVEVRPGTYRESVSIDHNLTLTAPVGATITDREFGIRIPAHSHAEPAIDGFTLSNQTVAVDASHTAGDWTIRDLDIRNGNIGLLAYQSRGDWTVRNASISDTAGIGMVAERTAGDWRVLGSSIRNVTVAPNATFPVEGVGVYAADATGAWAINRSALTDTDVAALNATGDAVRGDATHNYWGAASGPGGDLPGSGVPVRGNVTVSPFYADAAMTTLDAFGAPETFSARYDFEGTGSTIVDRTGNDYAGDLVGASRVAGPNGTAIRVDQADGEYARLGSADALSPGTGSYTIAARFNTTDDDGVLVASTGGGSEVVGIGLVDGRLQFVVADGSTPADTVTTTSEFADGAWHRVVAVRNATADRLALYVDGRLAGTAADGQGDVSPAAPVYVGAQPESVDPYHLTATVDDVRIASGADAPSALPPAAPPQLRSAVEYRQGTVELAFGQPVAPVGPSDELTRHNVSAFVDGQPVSVDSVRQDTDGARVVLELREDVTPANDVTVDVGEITARGVVSESVDPPNESVTVTSATATPIITDPEDLTVYGNATVALDFGAFGPDQEYELRSGNTVYYVGTTGAHSEVAVLDAGGIDAQAVNVTVPASSTPVASVTRRPLGLSATANATTISQGASVNVTATALRGDRLVEARVVNTDTGTERTYNYVLSPDGDLTTTYAFDSPGTYRVEVIDEHSGETATTGLIEVREGPQFEVTGLSAPAAGSVGEPTTVTATVTNTGDEPGTDTVQVEFLGSTVESRTLSLAPGERARVVATVGSAVTQSGSQPVTVTTGADSRATDLTFTGQQFTCAVSTGDPHLVTFDGLAYDFQAAGEFTLLADADRSTASDPLVVQVRQVPAGDSRSVATNNATATLVDGHEVMIDAGRSTPLWIDGQPVALASGESVAVGNGSISRRGDTITVTYPGADGQADVTDEHLAVTLSGDRLDLKACLDPDRSTSVEGLLGTPDGTASNDVALDNGTVLGETVSTDTLYDEYRESWRVTTSESLFAYREGRDASTYADPLFPESVVTFADLPAEDRQAAGELAVEAGLEPGTAAYRDAVLDYVLTGDSGYFASARRGDTTNVTEDADAASEPAPITLGLNVTDDAVTPGETTTVDLVARNVSGGVGAFEATVGLGNGSVATVTDVHLVHGSYLANVSTGPANASATVRALGMDTADAGIVTLATLTIRIEAPGRTHVGVASADVGTEAGFEYPLSVENGTLSATALDPVVGDSPPTDPDGDGVYEDVNGDGEVNVVDVQALFNNYDAASVQRHSEAFDFNGDGETNIVDVQRLFVLVNGES